MAQQKRLALRLAKVITETEDLKDTPISTLLFKLSALKLKYTFIKRFEAENVSGKPGHYQIWMIASREKVDDYDIKGTLNLLFEEIAEYRRRNNLPEAGQDTERGTVALSMGDGQKFYGTNSNLVTDALDIEDRRVWFDLLKGQGKLKDLSNLGQAQFLSHAEAASLINAFNQVKSLPKKMEIYVDRFTCNNCESYLGDLIGAIGVDNVDIYYKVKDGYKHVSISANL
ncbi:MAG: hypothetical protein HC880_21045 [Bacteroidia bacterium]|nr:hypothetical protein [Bacteroidia bacterium]